MIAGGDKPCFLNRKKAKMGISDRLRTIVGDLNISQTKFADTLGVSFTYINCLINGKRDNISRTLAILIQKTYDYSADWLMNDEGDILKKKIRRTTAVRFKYIKRQKACISIFLMV
jgi:plasmid maintenance system antidote protein VapI